MSIMPKSGIQRGVLGLFSGAVSVLWGFQKILRDGRLRALSVVPMVLTVLAYLLVMGATVYFAGDVLAIAWKKPDSAWLVWLWYLVTALMVTGAFAILALLFNTIAEAVGGPFFDKMALHVLGTHGLSGHELGLIEGTVPDLVRSLLFLVPAVICALLGLLPVVGVFFFVVGTGIGWVGLASTAINPALALTRHTLTERLQYTWTHVFTMLGMGAVIALVLAVPLLGVVVIPAGTVGATELFSRARVAERDGTKPETPLPA